jgi:hypothetical protein
MTESELLLRVERDGDEEDKEPLVNVFLWKQREGFIGREARVRYRFFDSYRAWTSHRSMVANGYSGIEHLPVRIVEEPTTYAREIDRLLDLYERAWDARGDEDMDVLLVCLNVIGPRIRSHPRAELIGSFAGFVMDHCGSDERLAWLSASSLALLVHDLGVDTEQSWPSYRTVLLSEPNRGVWANIPAWILGLRMYGERAAREIEQVSEPLGIDLLKRLAWG